MSYPPPPPPPAGEANEASAAPASKRSWTKPRIRRLRVINTFTGTIDWGKFTSSDEDNAVGTLDPQWQYVAKS